MFLAPLFVPLLFAAADLPAAIAAGDEAFARIEYPSAIAAYEHALAEHPDEPELLWRLARVYVCAGEIAQENDQRQLFIAAERCARRCIALDSLNGPGHTWLAGALGYIALSESVGRKVALSRELLQEALRALELNPNDDAAYSIIGSFYRALGNAGWLQRTIAAVFLGDVPKGGYDEAEAALKNAVRIAPEIMRHQYELGVLYLDMGRIEDARAALQAAIALPIRTAIDRPRFAKARTLLEELPPPQEGRPRPGE